MEAAAYRAAKAQVVEYMLQGHSWHEATAAAGLRISRSTAYHLLKRVRTEGEAALTDGRHGHPTKLRSPLRHWLEEYWRDRQEATCREAQAALEARFGIRVSQSHLSRVRTALGVTRTPQGVGEKGSTLVAPRANLAGGSGKPAAAGRSPGDGAAGGAGTLHAGESGCPNFPLGS